MNSGWNRQTPNPGTEKVTAQKKKNRSHRENPIPTHVMLVRMGSEAGVQTIDFPLQHKCGFCFSGTSFCVSLSASQELVVGDIKMHY